MTDSLPAPRTGVAPLPALPADFRAFHQLYRPAYVRWAELHLGNRADAEETVDRAFEQLATDWLRVLSLDSPAGYAWTLLKDRTVEAARARGRRPVMADTAAFETHALHSAVDPIGELEESLSIYQAIRELPERQHDVIVLRYCIGYSTVETADILGISVPGVRSTARYARHRLKEALGLRETGGAEADLDEADLDSHLGTDLDSRLDSHLRVGADTAAEADVAADIAATAGAGPAADGADGKAGHAPVH